MTNDDGLNLMIIFQPYHNSLILELNIVFPGMIHLKTSVRNIS